MEETRYPFSLPPLPYPADALAPFIDEETMRIHHEKHMQGYVDGLNRLLAPCPQFHSLTLCGLLRYNHLLPYKIQVEVARQAGGVYNHANYFEGLSPSGGAPEGRLLQRVKNQFSSLADLKNRILTCALSVFGSGYAMLCSDGGGKLSIQPFQNQQTPVPLGLYPLVTVDVWEHAYYLKEQNRRAAYLESWWQVVNWQHASRQYACLVSD